MHTHEKYTVISTIYIKVVCVIKIQFHPFISIQAIRYKSTEEEKWIDAPRSKEQSTRWNTFEHDAWMVLLYVRRIMWKRRQLIIEGIELYCIASPIQIPFLSLFFLTQLSILVQLSFSLSLSLSLHYLSCSQHDSVLNHDHDQWSWAMIIQQRTTMRNSKSMKIKSCFNFVIIRRRRGMMMMLLMSESDDDTDRGRSYAGTKKSSDRGGGGGGGSTYNPNWVYNYTTTTVLIINSNIIINNNKLLQFHYQTEGYLLLWWWWWWWRYSLCLLIHDSMILRRPPARWKTSIIGNNNNNNNNTLTMRWWWWWPWCSLPLSPLHIQFFFFFFRIAVWDSFFIIEKKGTEMPLLIELACWNQVAIKPLGSGVVDVLFCYHGGRVSNFWIGCTTIDSIDCAGEERCPPPPWPRRRSGPQ